MIIVSVAKGNLLPLLPLSTAAGQRVSCQMQTETGTPHSAMEKALRTTIHPAAAATKERRMDEKRSTSERMRPTPPPPPRTYKHTNVYIDVYCTH